MYWRDLIEVIRRNAVEPSKVKFSITRHGRRGTLTVMDHNLPRRKGFIYHPMFGDRDSLWWEQSSVANAAWHGGEIPKWGFDEGASLNKMARGYVTLVKILLDSGTLRPSKELDILIGEDTRPLAPNDLRFMYAR